MKAAQPDLLLIRRYLRGECDAAELPLARQALKQLEGGSGLDSLLDPLWDQEPMTMPAAGELYRRIAQALPPAVPAQRALPAPARRLRPAKLRKAMAMVLVGGAGLLLGAFWVVQKQRPMAAPPAAVAWLKVTTHAGQRTTLWLPDSSQVVLNAQSEVQYPAAFTAQGRQVKLTGEAFFRIKPDKTRPFTVRTRHLTATVLGTSFSVRAVPGQPAAEVAVVTGKVAVAGAGQLPAAALVLRAHEAARYLFTASRLDRIPFPDESTLAWTTDELAFQDAGFLEVAAQLEHFYGISVRIAGSNMTSKRFTGRFRHERLENVLESLRYTLGFDYTIKQSQVTISFK